MITLDRKQVYWICQLGGWSAHGLVSLFFSPLLEEASMETRDVLSVVMVGALGLAHTHLYRYLIKRWGWSYLPLSPLILRVVVANLLLAVPFVALVFVSDLLLGVVQSGAVAPSDFLFLLLSSSLLFFIWSLMYFAITFFRNYKREEIERLKWEHSIKDFELNKLKSQMNPHFVFNALNTIRALVEEDPDKAKTSINQLSNLLRNSLIAGRSKTITLAEEMSTVNDYLNLEKLRFEERLRTRVDITPEAMQVRVPPMIVQTLVENAVKHGISKKTDGGFIHVQGSVEQQRLQLTIKNSGVLQSINTGGFGILNTKQRLELLYGNEDAFHICQEEPEIVNAHLQIPL
ncbi:MAG: histidine kinase [Catalinimonas sp.]